MPFFNSHTLIICREKSKTTKPNLKSPQAYCGRNCFFILQNERIFDLQRKRAVLCTGLKASLTLEAAIAMTTFLLCMITILGILQVMLVQMHLMGPLEQTARQLARDAYVNKAAKIESSALSYGITIARAKTVMKEKVNDGFLKAAGVREGTEGLSFWQSDLGDGEGIMDFVVSYQVILPFQVIPLPGLSVRQCCRVHSWTGNETLSDKNEEQMVFVTPNGTVFHTSVTCSYLKLQIQSVPVWGLESLRNQSGGKYYPCERCDKGSGNVYITAYGDRYHGTLSCSGLKRGIRKIPISQANGKRPCSRCGQ